MGAFLQKIITIFMSILAFFGLVKPAPADPVPFKAEGKTVEFCFDSNHTTGYDWTAEVKGDCVELTRDEYVAKRTEPQVAGAGGLQYYTFTAVHEGKATVTFTYARSWETTDADRVITAEITVAPDLTVSATVFGAKDA